MTSMLSTRGKQEEVAGQIGLFLHTLQNKVFEADIFIVSVENLKQKMWIKEASRLSFSGAIWVQTE